MSNPLPFITCLCPTYKRPADLANLLACYLAQDYPADRRRLVIFDDAPQFDLQCGESWLLVPFHRRFDSLPDKYNAMAALARDGLVSIWEDDDIYLPWHLSTIARAYRERPTGYLVPRFVYGTADRTSPAYRVEESGGRFHGAWAFTYEAWLSVGGYASSNRLRYDQEMGRKLAGHAPGGMQVYSHPLHHASYVYRWGNETYHGSQAGDAGYADLWQELQSRQAPRVGKLLPLLDDHAGQVLRGVRGY